MVQYSYDEDGQLIEVIYPKSENGVAGLSYVYEEGWLTRIYALTDNIGQSLLRSYTYSADGKISEIRSYFRFREGDQADYIQQTYDYDIHSRINYIEYRSSRDLGQVLDSYR